MALILYSNGIIEGFRPEDNVFSDEELNGVFDGYEYLVSSRLADVANTWCLWGVMKNAPDNEFNKIGGEIVEEDIWSHLMLIHDSEIDPSWNITDEILYSSYEEYKDELGEFINGIVFEIQQMANMEQNEAPKNMIKLSAIGHTPDKRVLFEYDPAGQTTEFLTKEFPVFAVRIKDYLDTNFVGNIEVPENPDKNLIIFADNKTIVVVKKDNAKQVFTSIIDVFVKSEEYETAEFVANIRATWEDYVNFDNRKGFDKDGKSHGIDSVTTSETNKKKNKKVNRDKR